MTSSNSLSKNWWHPSVGLTWQWHISEPPVDTSVDAQVFDIDLFDNDSSVVDVLHALGRKVICYINVGSWEDWRPDKDKFPPEVLGKDYEGWPGEKWLDIRQIDKLAPIMRARLDLCTSKGFDAVEPDNMEIYTNNTGFPLTYQDQLQYALWLADETHSRGLAIGVKNAPDQVSDLVEHFDFAITEDAFFHGWTEAMLPFITSGKPVFAAEYTDMKVDFDAACKWGKVHQFSFILKQRQLDAWVQTCP
jgi:endo-alpha-1,4-polygalactosaminidase (GH114 family)